MTAETYIKAHLAALAHREAGHCGGVNNMLAVAFVVRNRQRAGWRGGNWMELIASHDEYSAWLHPATTPDLRELNFRILLQQIDDVFSGLAGDKMTEGALYYCELNRVERAWFKENVLHDATSHPRVAQVGNVSFFL